MNIRSLLWLLVVAPITAGACIEGVPAGLETFGPSRAQMVRSSWSQHAGDVRVLDSAAQYLRGAQVAFVLPDALDATFQDGTKRAVGTTNLSCVVSVPWFIAPSSLGIIRMRVELVANPAIWKEIVYGVSAPPASFDLFVEPWPSWDPFRASVLVAKAGHAHPTTATARVLTRQWPDGWSGVPVTFTLPEGGPSATFVGGGRSATVVTDASGNARAPAMIANDVLGTVRLKVSAPGAADFTLMRHANVGPTRTRAFAESSYTMPFPGAVWLEADVTFLGHPCWPGDHGPANPLVVVRANGEPFAVAAQPLDRYGRVQGCDGGNHELSYRGILRELSFGRHEISFGFEGDAVFDASEAAQKYTVEVLPHATGTTGTGGVSWQAGVMPHNVLDPYCTLAMRSVIAGGTGGAPPAPAGVTFPWGAFRYDIDRCNQISEFEQRVVVEFASDVPRGAKVLWHGARAGDAQARWHEMPTSADGNRLQFIVRNGGLGDTGDGYAAAIRGVAALALPEPGSAPGHYQDLWWGGPAQSGWGVGIAQQDAQLFVTLYAYDDAGNARWWVVPGGTWSADFKAFTGSVYQPSWPKGSTKMVVGAPAGTMTLEFHSAIAATMRYEIAGRGGERAITRQALGAIDAGVRWNHAGMWWYGPHANGRGVFVAQQGSTIFAVQYDYERDVAGLTTWSIIPGGRWAAGNEFVAPGWFEVSGPRFFAGYDPAAVVVERIDAARIKALAIDRLKMHLGTFFEFDSGMVERGGEIVRQPF